MKKYGLWFGNAGRILMLAAVLLACGCGQITDKDRIHVAKMGERYITRGDLFKIIREMPDTERPVIRTRNDLLRILNAHIDGRIKLSLGRKLAGEGKVAVDREQAREQFFLESGDEEEQLRAMWRMEVPQAGVVTPMMKLYGLTPELLQFNKDNIEESTDRMIEKLQGEQAVEYLAGEALKEGRLSLDEEEMKREYGFMKEQMVTMEELVFSGIRFLAEDKDALEQAAAARDRISAGETFESLAAEYKQKGVADGREYVFESGIMNNPKLEKFRGFWTEASGAEPGDILGPVYLPSYRQVAQDGTGREMPAAYIVLKVLEHKPVGNLEYDLAKSLVARPLLISKMIHLLREENGVEIYEDKLPDPSQFSSAAAAF